MSRSSSRRGLLISALLLLLVMAAWDLLRSDSVLVRAWSALMPDQQTPVEQGLEEFRRTRGESIRR